MAPYKPGLNALPLAAVQSTNFRFDDFASAIDQPPKRRKVSPDHYRTKTNRKDRRAEGKKPKKFGRDSWTHSMR